MKIISITTDIRFITLVWHSIVYMLDRPSLYKGNVVKVIYAPQDNISRCYFVFSVFHYSDVRMGAIASQITSLAIVYSTVYSDADQRKHQSSASLAFVWGIHRGPMNSPHRGSVTRKMFPSDDVIVHYGVSVFLPACQMGSCINGTYHLLVIRGVK